MPSLGTIHDMTLYKPLCMGLRLRGDDMDEMTRNNLSHKITELLSPDLAKECLVGSFNKGCLTLITTDASWAS